MFQLRYYFRQFLHRIGHCLYNLLQYIHIANYKEVIDHLPLVIDHLPLVIDHLPIFKFGFNFLYE